MVWAGTTARQVGSLDWASVGVSAAPNTGSARRLLKSILPGPDLREHGRPAVEQTAGMPLRGRPHCRVIAMQKRVGGTLLADRRRQRGSVLIALGLFPCLTFLEQNIGGFDRARNAKVREGVFVPAIDLCRSRQRRELVERGDHLRRRTFEKSSTACREQGVSAKEQWRIMVCGNV